MTREDTIKNKYMRNSMKVTLPLLLLHTLTTICGRLRVPN